MAKTTKEDPFFTNPANLAHFRESVKQKENGEVVELTKEEWKELLTVVQTKEHYNDK